MYEIRINIVHIDPAKSDSLIAGNLVYACFPTTSPILYFRIGGYYAFRIPFLDIGVR